MNKKEAIELIETAKEIMEWRCSLNFQIALDMAIEALKKNAEWVNVRERLPEDWTYVLTTIRPKGKERRVRSGVYHDGLFSNDNGDCWKSTDKELVAWMPLPEPYRGNR